MCAQRARVAITPVDVVAPVAVEPRRGLLSREIKKAGDGVQRQGLQLVIHLPTQVPFKVSVPVSATVEDVVQCVVREHKRERDKSGAKPLPAYESRCYELRLPDGDDPTLPDEDVPGLVRTLTVTMVLRASRA